MFVRLRYLLVPQTADMDQELHVSEVSMLIYHGSTSKQVQTKSVSPGSGFVSHNGLSLVMFMS